MAREGLCGQGTLAWLLVGARSSVFSVRMGPGASLGFAELQGLVTKTLGEVGTVRASFWIHSDLVTDGKN